MELSVNAYAVLGLVQLGSRSGYEIKRTAETSTRFFWALSPPQIYSELAALEHAKLLRGRSAPRGGRQRRVYELTPAGERVLSEWLRTPEELTLEVRDTGLLKLFFADVLAPAEVLEHVRRTRERSQMALERFRTQIIPLAERTDDAGAHYPLVAARYGERMHEWIVTWCDDLEAELERASRSRKRPRHAAGARG
jgi:PadR family transcriptional regulator AphA